MLVETLKVGRKLISIQIVTTKNGLYFLYIIYTVKSSLYSIIQKTFFKDYLENKNVFP